MRHAGVAWVPLNKHACNGQCKAPHLCNGWHDHVTRSQGPRDEIAIDLSQCASIRTLWVDGMKGLAVLMLAGSVTGGVVRTLRMNPKLEGFAVRKDASAGDM